jgi:HD-like signal output (HDOD) protein
LPAARVPKVAAAGADNLLIEPRVRTMAATNKSSTGELRDAESDRDAVIRKLSLEVAAGDVRLPSLPDIAVRVQKVLEDPRAARTRVTQVIGADAALAARIIRLANSAFLNPSSQRIFDLQQSVTRLGTQLVRCTAMSFSLQQMEFGSGEAKLRPLIRDLWRTGALVASIAYVLARETRAAKPDEALMTGLMHNIGNLYITVNTPHPAAGGARNEASEKVLQEWHPRIAGSILKYWKFPAPIVAAVVDQNNEDRRTDDGLTDVLVAALTLASSVADGGVPDEAATAGPCFQRLGLGGGDCKDLLASAAVQIKALRAALTN